MHTLCRQLTGWLISGSDEYRKPVHYDSGDSIEEETARVAANTATPVFESKNMNVLTGRFKATHLAIAEVET